MKNLIYLSLFLSLQACNPAVEKLKPNLLFIWTDEQQAFTMKAYGNNVIQTPNLDRLASESYVFEKAYVTQPLCTPNRAAVMTGLYPHTSGCINNSIPLPADVKTLPEIINDPAYQSAYMGKWHLGDEIFVQRGFETWVSIEDNYINFYSSDRDRSARSDYHHWLVEKGYQPEGKGNRFSRSFAARLPLEHCKPKFLEEEAINYLEDIGEVPFILYINFLEPHMPFFGPLDSLHDPDEIILPGNFNDLPGVDDPLKYHKKVEGVKKKYGHSEEDFRALIARYWGLVSQVDMSVGAILDKLDELGLSENTIVVYTSDHGDMMGAHRMMEKSAMYEESVRIPLLIKDPRLGKSQILIENRVSQIDIVPTLLDMMGSDVPEYLQGKSLLPALQSGDFISEDIFIESNSRQDYPSGVISNSELNDAVQPKSLSSPSMRGVISKEGWKLSLSNREKSQLFDLNTDPLETKNLYYDETYGEIVHELTMKIVDWQIRTGDSLVISK